jgi:hypothetical protein
MCPIFKNGQNIFNFRPVVGAKINAEKYWCPFGSDIQLARGRRQVHSSIGENLRISD